MVILRNCVVTQRTTRVHAHNPSLNFKLIAYFCFLFFIFSRLVCSDMTVSSLDEFAELNSLIDWHLSIDSLKRYIVSTNVYVRSWEWPLLLQIKPAVTPFHVFSSCSPRSPLVVEFVFAEWNGPPLELTTFLSFLPWYTSCLFPDKIKIFINLFVSISSYLFGH